MEFVGSGVFTRIAQGEHKRRNRPDWQIKCLFHLCAVKASQPYAVNADKYIDETGRKLPCYLLTRDGFVALAMSFTGKKADAFKEQYIKLFNEMEQQILTLQSLRDQRPMLTEAIKATRENPQPYDYSNEADMMNRIVLGVTAKQYREQHGIPKNDRIRPHMTAEEAELMERLQMIDVGLQYSEHEYQKRKQTLEWYAMKHRKVAELPKETGRPLETELPMEPEVYREPEDAA